MSATDVRARTVDTLRHDLIGPGPNGSVVQPLNRSKSNGARTSKAIVCGSRCCVLVRSAVD